MVAVDTSILKRYMLNFSLEDLKAYLGQGLVDTMLEWMSNNEVFTKAKLSEMILNVHGVNILKNKSFRKSLVQAFSEKEILSFRECLPNSYKNSGDLHIICDKISEFPCKPNRVRDMILEILNIPTSAFTTSSFDDVGQETLTAPDRFYELLDYQFVIKQRILNNLCKNIELNRMIVHMPTGTGKTKTAMHTLCHYYNFNLDKHGIVIWIAHTTELLQQAYSTFCSVWQHLGNGDVEAYKVWGSHDIDTSSNLNGIMFCGIQKLTSIFSTNHELKDKLIENCRLIIYDEAHRASASETKEVIEQLMVKKQGMNDRALVGLTATPGRATKLSLDNDLLVSMFSNQLIGIDVSVMNSINLSRIEALNAEEEGNIIRYFQNKRILSKIKMERLTYNEDLTSDELSQIRDDANSNGYTDFSKKVLEIIGKNKLRNIAIMQRLLKLNQDGIPTIVFACSVEHGQLLSAMLSIQNVNNALVIGNMQQQDRANAIAAFKDRENPINILINYEVLTTGFDSTNIRCVFIARPTQSVVLYSQMLGRGLRGPQMGGNEECLLIDVKDNLEKYNAEMAFGHFDNYWKA